MKVLIADLFSGSDLEILKQKGFEVLYDDKLNGESLEKAITSFQPEVLVVRSTKVNAAHMSCAPGLKAIIRAGSGYDTIDVKAANNQGVFVGNCPGKNAVAVAELIMGLILCIDRRIAEGVNLLKNKQWNKGEFSNCKGLKGRTLGLIGYGNVGREVAARATSFGMNVLIYSIPRPREELKPLVSLEDNLDELLRRSDFVSLSVPKTPETNKMVNKEFLCKMKKDAILINSSRGDIIDEEALLAHLDANKDFWAGVDVYLNEPADKKAVFESALAQHPRVYGTHHVGGSTKQAEAEIGAETVRMILKYQDEGVLDNCVNMAKRTKKQLLIKFTSASDCLAKVYTALANAKAQVISSDFNSFEGGKAGLGKIGYEVGDDAALTASLKEIKELLEFKLVV